MCLGSKPPKPDLMAKAPETPEEPPKAPIIEKPMDSTAAARKGRSSLRIPLNPSVSGSSLLIN